MNAIVQRTVEDIDAGTITLDFGAPNHLGATDLVEWIRAFRRRRRWSRPDAQASAAYSGSGSVELGRKTPIQYSTASGEVFSRVVIKDTANGAATIDINIADCGGKSLSIKEIDVCVSGVSKKMRVLCCDPYTP